MKEKHSNVYKIGAVSNLTGLSTHTIRAWERRYGMELSGRSDGGTRLYSEESLKRLQLLKRLLENGESISVLSDLNIDELEARLAQFTGSQVTIVGDMGQAVQRSDVYQPEANGGYSSFPVSGPAGNTFTECRLIYKSVSTEEIVSNETIAQITDRGAMHNHNVGITGLLVLSGNQFLQVLEGPTMAVNQLFFKIAKDPRHKDVQLVSFEQIGHRFFETWNMRLVDLWDLPGKTREYLATKYKSEGESIQIPDTFLEIYSLLMDAKSFCVSEPWR